MTFIEAYSQMKAFARIDGALLGLIWIASFACLIGNFTDPLLGFLWLGLLIYSPFFVGNRIARFRKTVLDGKITFLRAYAYAILTFVYAALIFAIAQWGYFSFIDNGFFFDQYRKILIDPQYKEMVRASGMTVKEIKETFRQLNELRPIDIALQFLWMNISISLFIGLPIAGLCQRKTN